MRLAIAVRPSPESCSYSACSRSWASWDSHVSLTAGTPRGAGTGRQVRGRRRVAEPVVAGAERSLVAPGWRGPTTGRLASRSRLPRRGGAGVNHAEYRPAAGGHDDRPADVAASGRQGDVDAADDRRRPVL